MPTAADRIVISHTRGGWEVKVPDEQWPGLYATSRSEALEWAWNIVRSTEGKVVVVHPDGTTIGHDHR